jgi:ATP-binding cassette subfamily G (WHITE) protein 2 (PDR)
MYRVSPFTYLVSGMMSTGIANTAVVCADIEYLHFDPPAGRKCKDYLEPYIGVAGGYLTEATKNATSDCHFCTLADTNAFLKSVNSNYDDRWRNFGIMFAFIIFNIFGAVFMYWLVRVPKNSGKEKEDVKKEKTMEEIAQVNTASEKMKE